MTVTQHCRDVSVEAYFERRLREHCGLGYVFDGITDPSVRKERIRRGILDHELGAAIIGRRGAKSETYRQAFERHFREKL